MDHFREVKNTLCWHNEGKFQAEVVNGVIKKLNFSEPGKGPGDAGHSLTSINFKYLQAIYIALGDLFNFIEEENKRMGYTYAYEIPFAEFTDEEAESEIPLSAAKLRPLLNFEQVTPDEPLRDISA